jgi:excisionase family DNA binding protein
MTVQEVADYLRVDPETVRRWLREGQIPGIHLSRAAGWRVRREELERFLDGKRPK